MRGTVVCGVSDSVEARAAAQLAAALSARLDLRLVLAHVVAGPRVRSPHAAASVLSATEAVARGLCDEVETRVVHASRVDGLAQVAADEGADMIVVGSRSRGARGRQLRCALACELEAAQTIPVLIAPPATRERSARRLALAEASDAR